MSGNTSATGGYLSLNSPIPEQADIEDALHGCLAGVTGLPGELIRPRWQPEAPRVPGPKVSWCAFGITGYEPDNFPVLTHHGGGDGHSEITDSEEISVLVSFYGPGHVARARLLRLALHVPQNRFELRRNGLAFARAGAVTPVPELVAGRWRARADLPLLFRLVTARPGESGRRVNVLNLLHCGSPGSFIETDTGLVTPLAACPEE